MNAAMSLTSNIKNDDNDQENEEESHDLRSYTVQSDPRVPPEPYPLNVTPGASPSETVVDGQSDVR